MWHIASSIILWYARSILLVLGTLNCWNKMLSTEFASIMNLLVTEAPQQPLSPQHRIDKNRKLTKSLYRSELPTGRTRVRSGVWVDSGLSTNGRWSTGSVTHGCWDSNPTTDHRQHECEQNGPLQEIVSRILYFDEELDRRVYFSEKFKYGHPWKFRP